MVTRKAVQLGQIVQPGQSLLTIVPLDDVWVTANFKETQLAGVRPGQRAEVHVDMYGQSFEGHVDSVAGATGSKLSLLPPENATGNFVKIVQRIPVKIVLDHAPAGVTFSPRHERGRHHLHQVVESAKAEEVVDTVVATHQEGRRSIRGSSPPP